MRIIPFLTSLPQVMILVTPMIIRMKLFGLRLPEVAHVFDGKLYFTRDHIQSNFIPKNLKLPEPKPAPKPRAKASSKASSSGEHVQLCCMVYDRKKGFQSKHL